MAKVTSYFNLVQTWRETTVTPRDGVCHHAVTTHGYLSTELGSGKHEICVECGEVDPPGWD